MLIFDDTGGFGVGEKITDYVGRGGVFKKMKF